MSDRADHNAGDAAEFAFLRGAVRRHCHELNNVLTRLQGHVALLSGVDAVPGERLERIQSAVSELARAAEEVHELAGRPGAPRPMPLAVSRDRAVAIATLNEPRMLETSIVGDDVWQTFVTVRGDRLAAAIHHIIKALLETSDEGAPVLSFEKSDDVGVISITLAGSGIPENDWLRAARQVSQAESWEIEVHDGGVVALSLPMGVGPGSVGAR